jgi:hypothetical protein
MVYSGHAEDLSILPELTGATWVEKPATAEVLRKALMGLRSRTKAFA